MMRKICILVPLLLLILLPVCGSDLRALLINHYNIRKTWEDAQSFCRKNHTDLVTIRDETDNQYNINGWIGLHRQDGDSEWKWSRGDEIANFTKWGYWQPMNGQHCVFTYSSYSYRSKQWLSDECDDDHSFTCYNETLVLVKTRKTWEEALMHCRDLEAVDPSKPANSSQNHRYDLATLLTGDDLAFAQEKTQESDHGVWTGLRFLAGQWLWVGGEVVQHMDIRSCPQSQKFCQIQWKGRFEARDCKEKRYFLCYRKPYPYNVS